jgi:hypothetical protein
MSDNAIFAAFFFPAAAAVLIFFLKYVSAIKQARIRLLQEEAYRDLAAKAAEAQKETAQALAAQGAALADIQSRMASLEKLLKEVG